MNAISIEMDNGESIEIQKMEDGTYQISVPESEKITLSVRVESNENDSSIMIPLDGNAEMPIPFAYELNVGEWVTSQKDEWFKKLI